MRVLAIETTERLGSVAVGDENNVFECKDLDSSQRSAESLAPGIRSVLETVEWTPQEIDLVAVTVGPGSFTGLRVGITTAKMFAYAVGAEVLGVDTLEVIASRAPAEVERVHVAIDAQRREVVTRSFRRGEDGQMWPDSPERLIGVDTWFGELPAGSIVSGPILDRLADRIPEGVTVLAEEFRHASADAVARVAMCHYAGGQRDDLWKLVPRYSRLSAAEERFPAK